MFILKCIIYVGYSFEWNRSTFKSICMINLSVVAIDQIYGIINALTSIVTVKSRLKQSSVKLILQQICIWRKKLSHQTQAKIYLCLVAASFQTSFFILHKSEPKDRISSVCYRKLVYMCMDTYRRMNQIILYVAEIVILIIKHQDC